MNPEKAERIRRIHYYCATDEQFNEWRRAAWLSRPPDVTWFCTDCTPSYQRQMIKQNKCQRPQIKFKYHEEDGWEAYVPSKQNSLFGIP